MAAVGSRKHRRWLQMALWPWPLRTVCSQVKHKCVHKQLQAHTDACFSFACTQTAAQAHMHTSTRAHARTQININTQIKKHTYPLPTSLLIFSPSGVRERPERTAAAMLAAMKAPPEKVRPIKYIYLVSDSTGFTASHALTRCKTKSAGHRARLSERVRDRYARVRARARACDRERDRGSGKASASMSARVRASMHLRQRLKERASARARARAGARECRRERARKRGGGARARDSQRDCACVSVML